MNILLSSTKSKFGKETLLHDDDDDQQQQQAKGTITM